MGRLLDSTLVTFGLGLALAGVLVALLRWLS
jgi:hypothetical protein